VKSIVFESLEVARLGVRVASEEVPFGGLDEGEGRSVGVAFLVIFFRRKSIFCTCEKI